jgi:hypothetical protein
MPVKTKSAAAKKTAKNDPERLRQENSKKAIAKGKARKKQEKNGFFIVDIDLCGIKLTALQFNFILNYVTPGQPCFHNALQAALKAGYSEAFAKSNIYGILQNPDIQKIVKKNEILIHNVIHDSAMRALELKQRRAFYDPVDYFQKEEISVTNKNGDKLKKSIMTLKPLEEMTPEQRMCIDGIDIKGAGDPVYLMADRERELNDIIKIDNDFSKDQSDGGGEEETMEIIMERLTVKKTMRKEKDEMSQTASLVRLPKGKAITEL